jgi:lipopolysaccharide/colanic/teichoic acid biosynthesis glycosyltransferase
VDDDSHIVGINPDNEDIYFETGIYVFEPQVLDWIPQRKKFGIHAELLPALTDAGKKIGACILSGYWNPLESYCDYHAAQSVYLNSVWREKPYGLGSYRSGKLSLTTKNIAPGVWTGRHTSIHPGARLSPPVLLGDNVRVGQGVELGPEVVIGDNVFIGDEATIQYTTIFDHTYVGKLVHLDNRVVDKNLVVDIDTSDYVFITDKFLLSETPYAIKETLFHRAFDAIIASFFLLLVIPLTFIIGFLLFILYGDVFQPVPRIKSGPTQQRSGQAPVHSVFYLLRFQTRQKDGGFTRIGKWLERVEWHRLPELWNVLVGDMRLVGVKPVAPEEVGLLTEVWQKTHLDYYPGFTGLWDIQNDSFIQPDDALIADIYYVATRTWKEDLNILLKTPQAWIKRIAA